VSSVCCPPRRTSQRRGNGDLIRLRKLLEEAHTSSVLSAFMGSPAWHSEPCHLARSVYRLRSRSRVAPIHLLSKPDSAPSLLPRHTPIEDPHGHGRRSSLTYYALMASRVGLYPGSNSLQRPRSIARGSHILAFTTPRVKEGPPAVRRTAALQ